MVQASVRMSRSRRAVTTRARFVLRADFARRSGHQKSQNGGTVIPAAGQMLSPYHRYEARVHTADQEKSLFDGVDVGLSGIASLAAGEGATFLSEALQQINTSVEQAMGAFSAAQPDKVAPMLAGGLKRTTALLDQVAKSNLTADAKYNIEHELRVKQAQFNDALIAALGVSMQATVAPEKELDPMFAMFMGDPDTFRMAIPGQSFGVKVRLVSQSVDPVTLSKVVLRPSEPKSWTIVDPSASGVESGIEQASGFEIPRDGVRRCRLYATVFHSSEY